MATLLAGVEGVRKLKQTIESVPDGYEPEDLLPDDAVVVHSLVVDLPDHFTARRVCEFASIVADLLDVTIEFREPANAGSIAARSPIGKAVQARW
jgi:hypothetical protein